MKLNTLPHGSPQQALALLIFCLSFNVFSQPKEEITLYTDDFTGNAATLGVGKFDYMTLLRQGITVIRSVRVPAGMKVILYQADNFSGQQLVLTEDANQKFILSKGFGQLQHNVSVEVTKAPAQPTGPRVTLYKDNFSGASKMLGPGSYDFTDLGDIDNDQLSSVVVPKGLKVILYEHSGFKGRKLELTQDASANELIKQKFNDATSSLQVVVVETQPADTVKTTPVMPITKETPAPDAPASTDASAPAVTIFQGDFSGTQKKLSIGKYDVDALGIGNDELSSLEIPADLRVTLYDKERFKGKSLRLTERTGTAQLIEKGFNNATSSILVEEVPRVSVFQGDFGEFAFRLLPGKYDGLYLDRLGLLDNEVSSVSVPPGMSVTLYEEDRFKGRALHLTQDASTDSLIRKKFNNVTSSIEVFEETTEEPVALKATLYTDNFTGSHRQLAPGSYDHADLGIGNNALSAITIPRGLLVTLYEHGAFEGRTLVLAKSVGPDLLTQYGFNDAVSSVKIEEIAPEDLVVTIYSDRYSGRGQQLAPGRYYARDLTIGDKQLSSVKVPKGMKATLYAEANCTGVTVILDRDDDFTGSKLFDNYYRSIVVEDVREPVVTGNPVVVTSPAIPEPPVPPTEPVKDSAVVQTEELVTYVPPCDLSPSEFEDAIKAVRSKPFSEEKMAITRLVTKDKCLTHDQIRAFAREFSFEEQSLEFVQYAYELSKDQGGYYKLEDVFRFMSTREQFRSFLQSR